MAQDDEDDAARGANNSIGNSRATTVIAVNSSPPATGAAGAPSEDVVEGMDPAMLQVKHQKVSRSSSDR